MRTGSWIDPVRITLDGRTAINISGNEQAARVLLGEWPRKRGAKHLQARQTLLQSMEHPEDSETLQAARKAFAAAAQEAHILLPALPHSLASPQFKTRSWRTRRR